MTTANPIHQAEPRIENPRRLTLPTGSEAILKRMFASHKRVVIKAELGSGFSGSWVFAVHPIKDVPELPAVIKIAPVARIEKEYQAYQQNIRNRLSGAAEIRSEPVLPVGSAWGGLRYHLVGGGIFEIESLNIFCRRARVEDIRDVFERLFRRLGSLWRFSHSVPQLNLGTSYDRLLPVNLLIRPAKPPPGAPVNLLTPEVWGDQPLQQGDHVRLEGFLIAEVDPIEAAVTLNLPSSATYPASEPTLPQPSYRLRLQPVQRPETCQVGHILSAVEGVVTATRLDLLHDYANQALTGPPVSRPSPGLPHPLDALPDILAESRDVKVAGIHGDLNLENILINPDTRDVRLIDFAMARWDHVLHDLLRLETGVVTWLLPETLATAELPPTTIHRLYEDLHRAFSRVGQVDTVDPFHPALKKTMVMLAAIRRAARECLFDPADWGEYYQSLTLYLLGALKFRNLDAVAHAPLPKQVAYWGAASAQQLRQGRLPYEEKMRSLWPGTRAQLGDRSWHIHQQANLAPQPTGSAPNPFTATVALRDPLRFIGREAELRRLQLMLQGGSVALLGQPKIGKSSLLFHMAGLWVRVIGGDVIGPLDCHALEDRDDLYEDLAAALGLEASPWRIIRRALNIPHGRPLLLLMDELDVGPERGLTHADLARLRAVCSANRDLRLMTASRTPLKTVFPDPGKGSPAYNFLQPLSLGPLTEAEARRLLAHPWAPDAPQFDAATCDQLLTFANGHPFKLQRVAFHRFEALVDPAYDWQAAYEGDLEQML